MLWLQNFPDLIQGPTWPDKAIQFDDRDVVGAVIVDRLDLRQHKALLGHIFKGFMKLPFALIDMNDRKFEQDSFHAWQGVEAALQDLFFVALGVNLEKYVAREAVCNFVQGTDGDLLRVIGCDSAVVEKCGAG